MYQYFPQKRCGNNEDIIILVEINFLTYPFHMNYLIDMIIILKWIIVTQEYVL